MDWKVVVLLLFTVYAAVHGVPQVTVSDGPVKSAITGDQVALTCSVNDLGNNKLNWVFVKHAKTITHGTDVLVHGNKYSLQQHSSSVFDLLIRDVTVLDQGIYKCEVDGTTIADVILLNVTDAVIPANVQTTPLNKTGCCAQKGISGDCLSVCAPTPDLLDDIATLTSCENHLADYIYCGSDGRNHENCCAMEGVPSSCLPLCSNDRPQVPNVPEGCLIYFQRILSCFEFGAVVLPSPPEQVSAVLHTDAQGQHSLWISWQRPEFNHRNVTGYTVFYRNSSQSMFTASNHLPPVSLQYGLAVAEDTEYFIYVVALGHHGSSQPSPTIDITTIINSTSQGPAIDICCGIRSVSEECVDSLCVPHLWQTFDTNAMLSCAKYLGDVFTCLADERDHSGCCEANNVAGECVPMCSGTPPPFNDSLSVCLPQLPIIAACIQQGLVTQPTAPTGFTLLEVTDHTARVSWTDPASLNEPSVDRVYVQLRRGGELAPWTTLFHVFGTEALLDNLVESENYAVRTIAETANISSLPSLTIRFRTLPETTPEFRPTVMHNLTECCEDSGMPSLCSNGCIYTPYMTAYYAPHLETCGAHIGTVLTCAADGRDHTACCIDSGVPEICWGMCKLNSPGFINPVYVRNCINATAMIVSCFMEGINDLVRMPEDVMVSNYTSYTITLQWSDPETGPDPEKYEVMYQQDGIDIKQTTTELLVVLQNLKPETEYMLKVKSLLNGTFSPYTQPVTVITTATGVESPFLPGLPTNISRALWSNRTHCCANSGIKPECQPLCLNQPTTAADCTSEDLKILACASDGHDHSTCCREQGLAEACVSLCGGHTYTNFTVRQAGCLAGNNIDSIYSCYLSNRGLLPAMPQGFTVENGDRDVRLQWSGAENCASKCAFDIHYWRTKTTDPNDYTSVRNVTSPYVLSGLDIGGQFTFTVTAANSRGSGPAAPWHTLYFGILTPDIAIAQRPATDIGIYNQGTDVTLICEVLNFPHQLSYSWYHRGHLLDNRDRVLLVDNVHRRSEGEYSCQGAVQDFVLSATTTLNVRYNPAVVSHSIQSASAGVGQEAVLVFHFRGHPQTVEWSKNGVTIQTTGRLSSSLHTLLEDGQTAVKLMITDVVSSDYANYTCFVTNQFGSTVAVAALTDPAVVVPTVPPSPEQKQNVTACCHARSVHTKCMPLCTMDVNVEEAINNSEDYGFCLFYFDDLIGCAADGGDHTLCCEQSGVSGECLPLCSGRVPPTEDIANSPHLLKCVPEASKILHCMETGYDHIPTVPRNVLVEKEGGALVVTWELPQRNADRVTSYTIHYNYTGHPLPTPVTIVGGSSLLYVLRDVEKDKTYTVWMTAENQNAGRSQPSPFVSIAVTGEPEKQEGLSDGATAGIVIAVLVAVALVIALAVYLVRRRSNGRKKLVETVEYENAGYDNTAVQIKSLPAVADDKY